MDKYVKNIIEETFASKKQQRYFYAKANDKSIPKKERKKWSKWAKEYSDDTDFEKIPEKVETEVDEIVDEKGNVARRKIPISKESKERLSSYGYDEKLKGDKVRLIENPKKFVNDYVESVLNKKSNSSDLVKKDQTEDIETELSPIIKRQVMSLKNTLVKNNVSVEDVINILKKEEDSDE